MSSKVKEGIIPHIFDRVHNPYYGYGTVIGVEDLDTDTETEYAAVILFDSRNIFLHSADDYEQSCTKSHFSVAADVRRQRCLWVQVYKASTEETNLNYDEVRLVPFDSLEYRQHPIRVSKEDNNKEEEENADAHVKEEDTVSSPHYYKIARVEPNELMEDLMSFEQHEGFLWGNIIKYAYRYGNKGEKAETVKKIRKYCDMLLEILEPKSELED